MNAQRLSEHFDKISEAPDAVPRLRRFILDLAVRGKLVEQDPGDEPAGELLKRIEKEKTQLIKARGIRDQDQLSPVAAEDVPFELPVPWVWTRLGTIGDWGSGCTPSRGGSEYYGGNVTWVKSGELEDKTDLRRSEETVTEAALRKCSFRLNKPGDVLIAMYGATIGKLAILAEPAVTNQAVCGCTPFRGVLNRYLFIYLLSRRDDFRSRGEGGAQPNISKAKIVNSVFPLPPLAEQHRIVAKVDELMALCDELEASQVRREKRRDHLVTAALNGLNNGDEGLEPGNRPFFEESARFYLGHLPRMTTRPEHVQQLRQTILDLAVRGKLVEQDPEDEPASGLLQRIARRRKALLQSGHPNENEAKVQMRKQEQQEVPPTIGGLPKGWQWATLMQCALLVVDCHNKTAPSVMTGIPLLRTSNIRNGRLVLDDLRFISEAIHSRWSARCEPLPGDILITREAPMGEAARIPEGMRICMGQRMMLVRLVPETIDPDFLLYSLRDPFLMERVQNKPVGALVEHLRVGGIETLLVPVPPLLEQRRIAAKIQKLMALCDELESGVTATATTRCRFLKASLNEALCE